jgi:hypothetical protein
MTADYEKGRTNLERLIEWYKGREGERNEATTRLQLIDGIFFDCLGWSRHDDVILEEPHGREYSDYTFLAPRRILILEAKKEGDYFELPAGRARLEYSLNSLIRDYPNLRAAIEQAARYCQLRGVPFGAVSNGHQVVAFIATRSDGLPPLEGKAVVFHSLDFMLENFLDLWQVLSKAGVEEKRLQSRLIGDVVPELPPKLAVTLAGYPGVKSRNVFQADLQTLSELIIEDLLRSNELRKRFLQECYSRSGALSQYALVSKTILQTRYAALFAPEVQGPTTTPAVDRDGVSAELLAQSLSRRPIILIGDVGVGKTTFVRYLIHVEAAPLFENVITIYINLGAQATLATDLRTFLLDEIGRQLREDHGIDIFERNFVRGIYHGDLERFSRGIYSDIREANPDLYKLKEIEFLEERMKNAEQHLKQSLSHIAKGRRKQIVFFIDNADQRDDATQQLAFLMSQEIAENWHPVTVFVALRPETFYRSLRIGTLSGYHPKAFTISPPRIDNVILKRLRFAYKLTTGEIPIQSLTGGIEVRLQNLGYLILVLLDSLERHEEIGECIDNIAGGNVRLALDLVRGFFGSGHVDTQKIVRIYERDRFYIIPLHEFLRAVIYGDAEHYDPEQSPVANLFDISQVDPKEHFLLPLTVGLLASSGGSDTEEGFVDTAVVYERLQGLGFTPEQIDVAIIRGHKKKLLETAARRIPQPGFDMPQALRVTTVGLYHIARLSRMFPYIDSVIVDTPILDADVREAVHNERTINERLDRADLFRRYLDKQWESLNGTSAAFAFDWGNASKELETDIEFIRGRVNRGDTI